MDRNRGFTLIEVLVALAVFAMAAIALMHTQTTSVRALSETETRTLADIVAENQMVEVFSQGGTPRTGRSTETIELAGRDWTLTQNVERTGRNGVLRVSVSVSEGSGTQVIAELSGFWGAR